MEHVLVLREESPDPITVLRMCCHAVGALLCAVRPLVLNPGRLHVREPRESRRCLETWQARVSPVVVLEPMRERVTQRGPSSDEGYRPAGRF